MLTIIDAIRDPSLFAGWFRDPATWRAWFAFLAALFALEMSEEELSLYQRHTQRKTPPIEPASEAWVIVGRRGGKSLIAALVAVFLAVFRDYSLVLAPGERGTVMCLAADRRQARTVLRYIRGFFDSVPMLNRMVEGRQAEAIHLTNRISIEVHTASFRSVRGYTIVAAICDEIAFWRDDTTANPDAEVVAALRPGMATVPGALLLGISSPYSRRGVLWEAHRRNYGVEGAPVLVWKADTRSMNPTIDPEVIKCAYVADEASARAEFGAMFRQDIETFITPEAVDAAVVPGRLELPPVEGVSYVAFTDPSGGASDSMTLAIAHKENGSAVLDVIREVRPPFSPETVTQDFAETLRRYRVGSVTGGTARNGWPNASARPASPTARPRGRSPTCTASCSPQSTRRASSSSTTPSCSPSSAASSAVPPAAARTRSTIRRRAETT